MRDEFEGRLWAENGRNFADAIDRLFADIGDVFERTARIHFAAPWRRRRETRLG